MPVSQTFTADGQTTLTELSSITLAADTGTLTVELKEGGSGGTTKFVFKAAAGTITAQSFSVPAVSSTGAWYVDFVSGTGTPRVTVIGF